MCLTKSLAIDMNLNGEMLTQMKAGDAISQAGYSNNLGQLNIGGWPSRGWDNESCTFLKSHRAIERQA